MKFVHILLAIVFFSIVRATFRYAAGIPEPTIVVDIYDLINAIGGIMLWKLAVRACAK